jgi:hypothetical protein
LGQTLPRAAKLRKLQALVTLVFGGTSGAPRAKYGTYYDNSQLYQWLGAGLYSNDHPGHTAFGLALRRVATVSKPTSRREGGQRKRFVHLTMSRPHQQFAWGGHGRRVQGGRPNQEQQEEKVKAKERGKEKDKQSAPLCAYRYKECLLPRVPKAGKAGGWLKLCVEHARTSNSYKRDRET